MAHRKSVRLSGRSHWSAPGQKNILVLCDHFYLYSGGELVWPHSRGWLRWVGIPDARRLQNGGAVVSRRERRSEFDACHGPLFLCLLDNLGAAGGWARRIPEGIVRAQG